LGLNLGSGHNWTSEDITPVLNLYQNWEPIRTSTEVETNDTNLTHNEDRITVQRTPGGQQGFTRAKANGKTESAPGDLITNWDPVLPVLQEDCCEACGVATGGNYLHHLWWECKTLSDAYPPQDLMEEANEHLWNAGNGPEATPKLVETWLFSCERDDDQKRRMGSFIQKMIMRRRHFQETCCKLTEIRSERITTEVDADP